jgi:acetyl-CoA synthetase
MNSFSEESDIKFSPPEDFRNQAHFSSHHQYKKIYNYSVEHPEKFWSNTAKELHWFNPWRMIKQGKAFNSKWFVGAKTNITYNCLDVHLNAAKRNRAALIWESEDGDTRIFTYQLLYSNVCIIANALKDLGIKKSDNIIIYMGMIPETIISMLACLRIGAIPVIVHTDLSETTLSKRINDLECKLIFTQDFILHKGSFRPLKDKVDGALEANGNLKNVIVFNRIKDEQNKLRSEKDIYWQELINSAHGECDAVSLDAQHPAFGLFTNSPKGDPVKILHRTGGYKVQAYISSKWIYDLKDEDIIWTTSNLAWVSSHTYTIFGPLLNGVTTFLYEGSHVHPNPDRFWQMISKYRINIFNTSPTLLKAFMRLGDDWITKHDLSSLRLLGTTSEPIQPETWLWYYRVIGKEKIPIVNTWMQNETGSIIISPLPGAAEMQPGMISYPFPGIDVDIVDLQGQPVNENQGGYLIINDSWPSMFSTEAEEKSETRLNCWKQVKGSYFTGDAAIRKKDGFIKILGRVDDVIISASNRVGGSEIENVLMTYKSINETAVVKRPDAVIGSAIVAYVSLKEGFEESLLLKEEIRNYVIEKIGVMARPDELYFIIRLPRLENGKINRRLLRKMSLEGTTELKYKEEEDYNILEKLREDYQKIYLR